MSQRFSLFCCSICVYIFNDYVYLLSHLCLWIQFDYLRSLEIEEKINKIRWYHTSNSAMFMLSTNDKTVKFWKVKIKNFEKFICTFYHLFVVTLIFLCFYQIQEKKIKKICNFNVEPQKPTINGFLNSSNVPMSSKACSANRITSLRLPMVVVCSLSFYYWNS